MNEFKKPTFNTFLTHTQIASIIHHTPNNESYSFNSLLGNTIREKYESIYVKLVEANNKLLNNGVKGWFWLVSSPEIISIFETVASCNTICNTLQDELNSNELIKGVYPQGFSDICYCGSLNKKWILYKDYKLTNEILIGANDTLQPANNYFCVKLDDLFGV